LLALYLVKEAPLTHVLVHGGALPLPAVYGKHSISQIPGSAIYSQAELEYPPWHPSEPISHETKSSGDKTTFVEPFVEIQILSEKDSEAPKAQHEPHCS